MKQIVKTSRLSGKLEKLFRMLNADLFDSQLQEPVITIQSTPRAYGHVIISDAWSVKGAGRRELNIGAGTLDRPIEDIVATIVHEMVHLWNNNLLNVQDCSRSGTYHNKLFRKAAEEHDLIVTRSEKYGWSHTAPSDELVELILDHDVVAGRAKRYFFLSRKIGIKPLRPYG